jgi:hypothetical protein
VGRTVFWKRGIADDKMMNMIYAGFFVGVLFTGFASIYYHLSPGNGRLVFDRLAMTVIFMSFLSAIIGERISVWAGLISFFPLILLGEASVFYWNVTERMGSGDLRLYAVVQYYTVVVIAVILVIFPGKIPRKGDIVIVFVLFAVSKICEISDGLILRAGHLVSGHTMKHLFAAVAVYWVLRMIRKRENALPPRE